MKSSQTGEEIVASLLPKAQQTRLRWGAASGKGQSLSFTKPETPRAHWPENCRPAPPRSAPPRGIVGAAVLDCSELGRSKEEDKTCLEAEVGSTAILARDSNLCVFVPPPFTVYSFARNQDSSRSFRKSSKVPSAFLEEVL